MRGLGGREQVNVLSLTEFPLPEYWFLSFAYLFFWFPKIKKSSLTTTATTTTTTFILSTSKSWLTFSYLVDECRRPFQAKIYVQTRGQKTFQQSVLVGNTIRVKGWCVDLCVFVALENSTRRKNLTSGTELRACNTMNAIGRSARRHKGGGPEFGKRNAMRTPNKLFHFFNWRHIICLNKTTPDKYQTCQHVPFF